MTTLIHQRVELARQGQNPTALCKMESGWAVFGDHQVLNGYCLLLPDPVVGSINDLSMPQREIFLRDMTIIGDALLEATDAWRINYEILGNADPALHAHIIPRYHAEPEEYRKGPVWFYPWGSVPKFDLTRHKPLMDKIRTAIERRISALRHKT
jgi:diadenosine tetraphosphate (Ap4A) HIT family hydrolase